MATDRTIRQIILDRGLRFDFVAARIGASPQLFNYYLNRNWVPEDKRARLIEVVGDEIKQLFPVTEAVHD